MKRRRRRRVRRSNAASVAAVIPGELIHGELIAFRRRLKGKGKIVKWYIVIEHKAGEGMGIFLGAGVSRPGKPDTYARMLIHRAPA